MLAVVKVIGIALLIMFNYCCYLNFIFVLFCQSHSILSEIRLGIDIFIGNIVFHDLVYLVKVGEFCVFTIWFQYIFLFTIYPVFLVQILEKLQFLF